MSEKYHSGFISLVGRPNVGKSTLLNALVGQQISITANKPQTTRNQIRGIVTEENYQAILLDTPGIHLPQNELHNRIVGYALKSLKENDLVFHIIEPLAHPNKGIEEYDTKIIDLLPTSAEKSFLIVNKTDLYKEENVFETTRIFSEAFPYCAILPTDALHRRGIDKLKGIFPKYLPEGIPHFPTEQITDTPERAIVGELVREQIMRKCFQEIPYGVAVEIEKFKESESKVEIHATIHVEREAHKKIIIGKGGSMLKMIGTAARIKMEQLLGTKVRLDTHVKISKNWFNNPNKLSEFGYGPS